MSDLLRLMNLSVDGRGYAGEVENVTPPKLTIKTEDDRSGGMDGTVKRDVGMEPMEMSYSLKKVDPDLMSLFGLVEGGETQITLRGALDRSGTAVSDVINVRGTLSEVDDGEWTAGKKVDQKHKWEVLYYKRTIDGKVVHEIDVLNSVRIINGVDQLKALRDAAAL